MLNLRIKREKVSVGGQKARGHIQADCAVKKTPPEPSLEKNQY